MKTTDISFPGSVRAGDAVKNQCNNGRKGPLSPKKLEGREREDRTNSIDTSMMRTRVLQTK